MVTLTELVDTGRLVYLHEHQWNTLQNKQIAARRQASKEPYPEKLRLLTEARDAKTMAAIEADLAATASSIDDGNIQTLISAATTSAQSDSSAPTASVSAVPVAATTLPVRHCYAHLSLEQLPWLTRESFSSRQASTAYDGHDASLPPQAYPERWVQLAAVAQANPHDPSELSTQVLANIIAQHETHARDMMTTMAEAGKMPWVSERQWRNVLAHRYHKNLQFAMEGYPSCFAQQAPAMLASLTAGKPAAQVDDSWRRGPLLATSSNRANVSKRAAPIDLDDSADEKASKKTTKKARRDSGIDLAEVDYNDDSPIYDDCNDIRRKIRAYLAEGNKVTHFLRDIGGVNSNSYQRFMAQTGPAGGCSNSTYSCAYHFFERKRIAEGKPKSKKRKDAEDGMGHSTRRQSYWVLGRA